MLLVTLTATALAAAAALAVWVSARRRAQARPVLCFLASEGAALLTATATAGAAPLWVRLGAITTFALTILALAICVWRLPRGGEGEPGGDGDDGRGGGRPHGPRRPEPQPGWWPQFEREFRAYADACAKARRASGSRTGHSSAARPTVDSPR